MPASSPRACPRPLLLFGLSLIFLGAAPVVAGAESGPPEAPTVDRATPPPTPTPRRERAGERRGPQGQGSQPAPEPRSRRPLETAPAPSPAELQTRESLLEMPITEGGCSIRGQAALVKRLLGLEHRSQALSLEVWGDLRAYGNGQKVLFFVRVPFRMYVTIFWVGPRGEVFVPFDNIAVPAHRNVMVDPEAIIVPPLGLERWVAVATLEPVALPCGSDEATLLAMVDRLVALPHAIGRWSVWSGPKPDGPAPKRPGRR